jgi:hypothetical protein
MKVQYPFIAPFADHSIEKCLAIELILLDKVVGAFRPIFDFDTQRKVHQFGFSTFQHPRY